MSSKIIIPKEFDEFYEWTMHQIEKNGEYYISGCFEWRSDDYGAIKHWFNFDYSDRFGVFGAGSTGNLYAFWIDDKDEQKVIHLGSEGDNLLVLGNNFVEFLQYLSIGYSDPEITDFNLTFEQIEERDKVDYSQMSVESLNEYEEKYSKPLRTEEGIKELFGEDIDDETLKMFLEINQNAAKQMPKIDTETVEKAKKEIAERDRIVNIQQKDFKEWVKTNFNVKLPKKGTDILNLNDKSFENWVNSKLS